MASGNLAPLYQTGLSKNMYTTMSTYPTNLPEVFHHETTDMRYVLHQQWEGYQLPRFRVPGQSISQGSFKPSYNKVYFIRNFALGDTIPEEDIRDDIYGVVVKMMALKGGWMGRAFMDLREYDGANFYAVSGFASGTLVAGMPDGRCLFNTAHPVSLSQSGITVANRPTVDADLSITTAQAMVTALETQLYPNNLTPMNNRLRVVVGYPVLQFVADQIFNGIWERGTADRNTNEKLRSKNVRFIPWYNFQKSGATGTNNAYFGLGQEYHQYWFDRQLPESRSDFDVGTWSQIMAVTCRYENGSSDWRGSWASSGA